LDSKLDGVFKREDIALLDAVAFTLNLFSFPSFQTVVAALLRFHRLPERNVTRPNPLTNSHKPKKREGREEYRTGTYLKSKKKRKRTLISNRTFHSNESINKEIGARRFVTARVI